MKDTIPTQIYLLPEAKEWLQMLAKRNGTDMSTEIHKILRKLMERLPEDIY